jgi:hypothetical protein
MTTNNQRAESREPMHHDLKSHPQPSTKEQQA